VHDFITAEAHPVRPPKKNGTSIAVNSLVGEWMRGDQPAYNKKNYGKELPYSSYGAAGREIVQKEALRYSMTHMVGCRFMYVFATT